MTAGKMCQMSSPVVYSLSQADAIQRKDECIIFHSRMSLLIKGSCSLPIPTMSGLDHYNRSMKLWLLWKFRETEQKKWCPTHGVPCSHPTLAKAEEALFIFSTGVTFLVFKLPFWLHIVTYQSFTAPRVSHRPAAFTSPKTSYKCRLLGLMLDILNQNLHFKQDVQVTCMFIQVGELLIYIR